jgi:protein-tyrosine phosphatase
MVQVNGHAHIELFHAPAICAVAPRRTLLYRLFSMVDIHCHILPGIDDGAKSMEIAVEMAEIAIADGITHVIATPHSNAEYKFHPELILQLRNELQAKVEGRLKLATGCDFHLSYENLADIQVNPTKYTLNQKNFLLVEFADFAIPPNIDDTLHMLHLLGLHPIITHPERNGLIRHQPEKMWRWMRQGCYVQVTAQALLGRFGKDTAKILLDWLDKERIHFVATDAHSVTGRPLKLREAYDLVAKRCGTERADALFIHNPMAAFEGRPLPYQPTPPPDKNAPGYKKRKRFIFF